MTDLASKSLANHGNNLRDSESKKLMRIVQARVISANCAVCRLAVAEECASLGLPQPKNEIVAIADHWLSHTCNHEKSGLVLRKVTEQADLLSDNFEPQVIGLEQRNLELEAEQLPWEINLDAKKNWGYPCREAGRYGSYPSHDGFDDESCPD